MSSRPLLPGLLLAGAGAIGFSGKAIIVKLSYRYGVDTVTLLMYRMLFALPLFAIVAWLTSRDAQPLTRHDWLVVLGLGFSGYYLASFLDFAGLQYISANLERLILYLNPTLVLALSAVVFKQQVGRAQWMALALSYSGALVVFSHDLILTGPHVVLGSTLVFASAVSYAFYLLYSGAYVSRLGALRLSSFATCVACILCIGQFLAIRPVSAMVVAREVIWLAIANATLCTFAPVLLVMVAIERIGAPLASQVGMIGPMSTIVLSAWILAEPITLWTGLGTALVLSGVWLLARVRRGPQEPAHALDSQRTRPT